MALADFETLPDIGNVDGLGLEKLPTLFSPFFVPFLEDRPHNPIVERRQQDSTPVLPKELIVFSEQLLDEGNSIEGEEENYDIWEEAARLGSFNEGRIASWDGLRKDVEFRSREDSATPFLSEQSVNVVSAARFHARPPLLIRNRRIWHVSSAELIDNLSSVLLGCSSAIYVWDNAAEQFAMRKSSEEEEGYIFLDGMDEVSSESYIKRFLAIGTQLRRLELFALYLRGLNLPSSQKPATTYAFAHALSAITIYLQNEATHRLRDIKRRGTSRLVDFWFNFDSMQTAVGALARLCGREFHLGASFYSDLPRNSPPELLSHIYKHLTEAHRCSGTKASLAFRLLSFMMTVASKPYLADIEEEIGLNGRAAAAAPKKLRQMEADELSDRAEEEKQDNDEYLDEDSLTNASFPAFISDAIGEAIIRAKRSIHVLNVADTPLFENSRFVRRLDSTRGKQLQWLWNERDIIETVDGDGFPHNNTEDVDDSVVLETPAPNEVLDAAAVENHSYPDEIADVFNAFDLEPGTHVVGGSSARQSQVLLVEAFLSNFPDTLPSITPTLPLLAERILNPIILQADTLSRASLRIFFGEDQKDGGGGGLLHFRSHVILLRSYLLTMGSSFRERLQNALYSDSAPGEELDERARSSQARHPTRHVRNRRDSSYPSPSRPWVVGLARGLMVNSNGEHEVWPPGGSDLSFYLRRVIMDSVEHVRNAEFAHPSLNDNSAHNDERVYNDDEGFWDDVEGRLGFAIRDLPVGSGPTKGKWMDPNSIEALDFLFMDYKPPKPLRTLITKEILSKYQRMFTFLLRLMRVQNAIRAVHRVANHSNERLFASNKSSRQLFEHFLFAAHGLVSALSSYVSQTAIGGNIDAFLARIAAAEAQSHTRLNSADYVNDNERFEPLIFEDVHALAQAHSKTLNDILSACLQRASQQAYGDLLKSCLEVLLEFCTLIGDLVSRKLDENDAAARLGVLWERWRGKVSVFAKALHKLADKGVTTVHTSMASHSSSGMEGGAEKNLPFAVGGVEALADLLIRLDFSDWWKNLPLSK